MNEKEKKAIEFLKENMLDYEEIDTSILLDINLTHKTLLNLIEKLQKENEILKEEKEQAWEEWNNLEQGSCETEQKLKEENRELKKQVQRQINAWNKDIKSNYISKHKVKDKIEELNSRIEIYRKYVEQGIGTDVEWIDNIADRETVKVLKELIEEREDN